MFYSTDILARRRSGFGLFWLAATLGPKGGSGVKKMTKKEILGCNLVEACDRLSDPEEPLALRLSSNLLCGIARVYQQQYIIYFADVSTMHQSLKKAISDVFKKPLLDASIDLAPAIIQAAAGAITTEGTTGGAGINLTIDPAIAVLGWQDSSEWEWALQGGIDWGRLERGEVDELEEDEEFSSGVFRESSPATPQVRRQPTGAFQARDLADISLHEPQLDDYKLAGDAGGDFGEGAAIEYEFGEHEPGILEGVLPELDDQIAAAEGRVGSRAGSGRGGWGRAGGVSSSAAGGDQYQAGGDDFFHDFGGEGFAAVGEEDFKRALAEGDETAEDRVAREHAEGEAQRAAGPRVRESSVAQPEGEVVGSVEGTPSSKRKRADESEEQDQAVAAPKPAKVARKKRKSIVIDDEISLSDATLSDWRKTYSDRMRNERNKAEKTKSDLEETKRGMDLIFGAPEGWSGDLAKFWNDTVTAQLVPLGGGRAAEDKKKRKAGGPAAPGPAPAAKKARESPKEEVEKDLAAELGLSGDWEDVLKQRGADDGFAFPEGGVEGEVGLGEEFDFGGFDAGLMAEDVDQGRAGSAFGSQRQAAMPWNIEAATSDMGAGFGAAAGSSQAGRRASVETPFKAGSKRRSRSVSQVPSALGSGAFRAGSEGVEQFEEGLVGEEGELEPEELSEEAAGALATLERDSFNFLAYTKRQSDATVNDLFFSDIVPVADTDPMAAAQALYHVLCLSTKKLLKVRQKEPYGDIHIEVL